MVTTALGKRGLLGRRCKNPTPRMNKEVEWLRKAKEDSYRAHG